MLMCPYFPFFSTTLHPKPTQFYFIIPQRRNPGPPCGWYPAQDDLHHSDGTRFPVLKGTRTGENALRMRISWGYDGYFMWRYMEIYKSVFLIWHDPQWELDKQWRNSHSFLHLKPMVGKAPRRPTWWFVFFAPRTVQNRELFDLDTLLWNIAM